MMAQGYKLRLGDGTTFAVDEKGLHTWLEGRLMDESARIQPQGTTQWLTVRQLRVFEREAAERQAIERRLAEEQAVVALRAAEAEEERKSAEEAVEKALAAEAQAEAERKAEQERRAAGEDAERRAAAERAEAEKKAAAEKVGLAKKKAADKKAALERKAAEEKKAAEDRKAAEARAAADKAAADKAAAEKKAAAERKAAEEKRAAEERKAAEAKAAAEKKAAAERKAADERRAAEEQKAAEARAEAERKAAAEKAAAEKKAAAERKAADERRAAEERKAAEARAEAERKASAEKAAAEKAAAEQKAAAERKAAEERRAAAEKAAAAEKKAAAERKAAEERAARERAAEEERRAAELRAAAERKAAEERKAEAERRAAEERRAEAERKAAEEQAAREREIQEREREAERRAAEERAERERQQAEADRPRTLAAFDDLDEPGPEPAGTEIGLEPLAMGGEGPLYEMDSQLKRIPMIPQGEAERWEEPWEGRGPAPRSPFETRVAWVFDRISPIVLRCEQWVVARMRARRVKREGQASAWPDAVAGASGAQAGKSPMRWLELPKAWGARAAAAMAPLLAAARGALGRLRGFKLRAAQTSAEAAPASIAEPPVRDLRPEPAPIRLVETAPLAEPPRPRESPRPAAASAPPVAPARPPAPYNDLPVIALAKIDEPAADEDEFDDGPMSRLRDGVAVTWVWIKSLTVPAILLVVIAVLVSNYKAWFPRAMGTTMRVFSGMDELKARYAPPPASREALQVAEVENPHLSPATIEAIMARAGVQTLPPTDIFRRATEATLKGKASLPPTASGELDSHMSALLSALSEGEAERLRAYLDRLAAGEALLPHEDSEAMWLTARGARRLPPDRLARVQQLSAQAVSAGLGAKPAPEDPALPSLPPLPLPSLPAFEGPSR
jgi:hypothetical protein